MRERIWRSYDRLIRRRDDVLGQDLIYKQYLSTTPGRPALGKPDTPVYADVALFMPIIALDAEEISTSGGLYHLGDQAIEVRELTADYADRVVIGGKWYRPIDIKPIDVAGPHGFAIVLREVAND
ncbi:hypothetical protein KQR54_18770 [Mycobacterium gordonae]|nr:hypothetical protein [Mycobacterium gordonae]